EDAAKWNAFGRYLEQMQTELNPAERLVLVDTYLPWAIAFGYDTVLLNMIEVEDRDYRWGSHQYRPWLSSARGSESSGSSVGGSLQSVSDRSMSGLQSANFSMFAMLNSASSTLASGSGSS